MSFK
jgi:hypothetical protein